MKPNVVLLTVAAIALVVAAGFSIWKSVANPFGAPPPITAGKVPVPNTLTNASSTRPGGVGMPGPGGTMPTPGGAMPSPGGALPHP